MAGAMDFLQEPGRDHGFQVQQRVVTLVPEAGYEGPVIPPGAEGVIVATAPSRDPATGWSTDWFYVEFFWPAGVVAMTAEHLRPVPSASPAFCELDRVRTVVDMIEDGQRLPSGSTGTVVDVGRTPGWYEVEFTQPFQAVVTLTNVQIAPVV